MKPERLKRWEKTRQGGKRRFILVYGVLGWGVATGILACIVSWIWDSNFNVIPTVPMAMIIFPIGGIFWGWLMWHITERIYHAAQSPSAS